MTGDARDTLSAELVAAVEQVLRRRRSTSARAAPASTQNELPVSIDTTHRVRLISALYRARRDRDAIFSDTGLGFGEPSWDMLLDLYRVHLDQGEVSVTSACIASAAPPTTGLRHLLALERSGLVTRRYDPFDRRRCFVGLSASGVAIMDRWIARLAGSPPASLVVK